MHKKRAFLRKMCMFLRIYAHLCAKYARFCLTHFNTCAFARAKTPFSTQNQTSPKKIILQKPQKIKNSKNSKNSKFQKSQKNL